MVTVCTRTSQVVTLY